MLLRTLTCPVRTFPGFLHSWLSSLSINSPMHPPFFFFQGLAQIPILPVLPDFLRWNLSFLPHHMSIIMFSQLSGRFKFTYTQSRSLLNASLGPSIMPRIVYVGSYWEWNGFSCWALIRRDIPRDHITRGKVWKLVWQKLSLMLFCYFTFIRGWEYNEEVEHSRWIMNDDV